MATLADDVLADLDELDGDDESGVDSNEQEGDDEFGADEMDITGGLDFGLGQASGVKKITKLLSSTEMQNTLKDIDERMHLPAAKTVGGNVEDNVEYKLVLTSTKFTNDIDGEIAIVHKYIRDMYAKRFPELESLVVNPLDYAKVVKRIGNDTDIAQVELGDILNNATVMVVTVTATTTNGKPLDDASLALVLEACDEAIGLENAKKKLLQFVESRMSVIAPNVTEIVGSEVAARMVGAAGSLNALSRMPACNVMLLGRKKKVLVGLGSAQAKEHTGFIYGCKIVEDVPPALRAKAQDTIANKVTLAARVDAFNQDPTGGAGRSFMEQINKTLDKLQEPPPPKSVKAIKPPIEVGKKRRGGKLARKLKEKFGVTDLHKAANRMVFGEAEDTVYVGDEEHGLGMINKSTGSGKARMAVQENKFKAPLPPKKGRFGGTSTAASRIPGAATNGTASSLTFTPIQGLELANPNADAERRVREANSKGYFSVVGGFRSVMKG